MATSDGKSPFGLDIVQLSDVADNIKVYPPTALVTSNGEWHLHGEYDFAPEKLQDSVGLEVPKIRQLKVG